MVTSNRVRPSDDGALLGASMDLQYVHSRLAAIYDLDNGWDQDLDFYFSLASESPRTILDLGCGTGTLCCAFARAGHRVVGVDPAPAMLAVAAAKPDADAVEWVESTAQSFESDERFDLIVMTGHAFQVFLTDDDILAVLGAVRRHLKEGGVFAFESRNPDLDWGRAWSSRAPVVHELPEGELRETFELVSAGGRLVSFRWHYELPDETLTSESTLRFATRSELEALMEQSGLAARECFGDWDRRSFDPANSPEMIFVVEAAD